MDTKRFVLSFITIVFLVIVAIVGLNIIYDKTGILNPNNMGSGVEPSQHFVKMRYLVNNPNKYNAFAFGSSRVGNCDLTIMDDGLKYYNMTYAGGLPEEWLGDLKLLLNAGVKPRRVILALDDFSFRVDPKTHENNVLFIPYKENNIKTYIRTALSTNRITAPSIDGRIIFDIYGSGRPMMTYADESIEDDYKDRLREGKFTQGFAVKGDRSESVLLAIKEIKDIATKNSIELIVWYNPVHHKTYLDNNLEELNEFKRRLAEIVGYWDFSGINEITSNDYYWYECSHYRVIVGDMILRRVFDLPGKKEGFGVYVEKTTKLQN